jgi:ParB-like chromosome segregation protein Spo0J
VSQPSAHEFEAPAGSNVADLGLTAPATGTVPGTARRPAQVPILALLPADSPRLHGHDDEHVARLAELDEVLPPILVDRRSMRVIDGMHRLLAASRRGQELIDVEFFDGTAEEAFLRGVEANVTHGLPLSQEDRRAAAERIVRSHPLMSDRAIARASGLSAKSVAAVRARTGDPAAQPAARIGRDGKAHPVNNVEGRRRAAEIIAGAPTASLREVARQAGISPATVSDVRKRLAEGELPYRDPRAVTGPVPDPPLPTPSADLPTPAVRNFRQMADPAELLDTLLHDPSLRMREDGRQLLLLLRRGAVGDLDLSRLAAAVPTHCYDAVAELVTQYTRTWLEFARELDQRARGAKETGGPGLPAGTA